MQRRDALRLLAGCPVALATAGWSIPVHAQVTRGFDHFLAAVANGDEIQRQPDLWVFEVNYKPMRMIWVDVTDPRTGDVSRDQIWYLAYRTRNRSLGARAEDSNTTPVNALDPLPGPSQFMPEFVLTTHEDPTSEVPVTTTLDEVTPEAVAAINQRELRRSTEPRFLNTVEVVQPLPETVADESDNSSWIYGVATWRNIDPETDFFTVTIRGFSNGYDLRSGPDGKPIVWRKAIVQKFTRRGDRFDPNQGEFKLAGEAQWVYLPDLVVKPESATP